MQHTMLRDILLLISSFAIVFCTALPSESRPSRLIDTVTQSRGAPDVDSFTYLDNGVVRLGIDLTRGGTLGWFGPSNNSSFSLLNIHDFGRVVQGSFYSGPNPFNPAGKCSEPGGWGQPWPWNPIGAGDVYVHAAPILNVTVSSDNASATVWTRPLQWACDNVPCDCAFEQSITLVDNAVQVKLTVHMARADLTFYPGYTQELPAVYVIGDYCHLWTYNETSPFTGDTAIEQPAVWGVNAWDAFTSGERWMAFTNASGWGVGVVSESVAHFGAGFFNNGKIGTYNCTPQGLGPYDSPTGYIAPWSAEILDAQAPFSYNFSLVLGTLEAIRLYAYTAHAEHRDDSLTPQYDFMARGDRAHCVFGDAQDTGLPISAHIGGIELNITGPHPSVIGPLSVWPSNNVSVIYVNASFDSSLEGTVSSMAWQLFGTDVPPCSTCFLNMPVTQADGNYHVLSFNLTTVSSWINTTITRIIFQPLGAAPVNTSVYGKLLVRIASITSD